MVRPGVGDFEKGPQFVFGKRPTIVPPVGRDVEHGDVGERIVAGNDKQSHSAPAGTDSGAGRT